MMFGRPTSWWTLALTSAVLVMGCGDDGKVNSGTETDATTSQTTTETGSTTDSTTTTEGTTTPTTSEGTTMGGGGGVCDPKTQDCTDGEKCITYDSPEIEDSYWDANQCVPIPMNPGQKGDSCDINMGEGLFSGLDNCAEGTMCFNFDFSNGQDGVCTAYCDANSECGANEICLENANGGVLPLCLHTCNPLTQDCPNMHACYGDSSLPEFFCARPDPGEETGMDGAPCQFTNACLAGFACVDGTALEGCVGSDYCCTPYCSVSEGDAGCAPTEDCVPFYPSDPPPGLEDVGLCAIPQ